MTQMKPCTLFRPPNPFPNPSAVQPVMQASKFTVEKAQQSLELMFPDPMNRDQIANICRIIEKARELQKNIYFCFIDYAKASDCVDHNKPWKILKEIGIPET